MPTKSAQLIQADSLQKGDTGEKVKKAFDEAKKGNFELTAALPKLGAAVIEFLEPYLDDPDISVKSEVIGILSEIGGEKSLGLLTKALNNSEGDIQRKASETLYTNYSDKIISSHREIGAALKKSIESGNDSAAAIFLLSRYDEISAEKVLQPLSEDQNADRLTKLSDSSPAVRVAIPAQLALAKLGKSEARNALLSHIESAPTEELEFLLDVLNEIDSPEILHLLKITLEDRTEISGGVPSHAVLQTRLCDLAVNAFVKRLTLKVRFKLTDSKRYSVAQISQVRKLIDGAIPK